MDVTDTTPGRLEVAIELFVAGQDSLVYEGVVLWKDKNRALEVFSYSEFAPENTTPEMARKKIQRAKLVLANLCAKNLVLKEIASNLPHEHYCCWDYGKGAIALAKEIGGVFEWCYERP